MPTLHWNVLWSSSRTLSIRKSNWKHTKMFGFFSFIWRTSNILFSMESLLLLKTSLCYMYCEKNWKLVLFTFNFFYRMNELKACFICVFSSVLWKKSNFHFSIWKKKRLTYKYNCVEENWFKTTMTQNIIILSPVECYHREMWRPVANIRIKTIIFFI